MKLRFDTEGDFSKTREWLARNLAGAPIDAMRMVAKDGERSLANSTPKDTGETAEGWKSKIVIGPRTSEILWYNTAHPGAQVNVAKIIDQGHGTGTGGYVPPRPYIKTAMGPIWNKATDKIAKEMTK